MKENMQMNDVQNTVVEFYHLQMERKEYNEGSRLNNKKSYLRVLAQHRTRIKRLHSVSNLHTHSRNAWCVLFGCIINVYTINIYNFFLFVFVWNEVKQIISFWSVQIVAVTIHGVRLQLPIQIDVISSKITCINISFKHDLSLLPALPLSCALFLVYPFSLSLSTLLFLIACGLTLSSFLVTCLSFSAALPLFFFCRVPFATLLFASGSI